jgi:hypothetical protein
LDAAGGATGSSLRRVAKRNTRSGLEGADEIRGASTIARQNSKIKSSAARRCAGKRVDQDESDAEQRRPRASIAQ